MKVSRIILFVIVIIFLYLVTSGILFLWRNLRGIGPVITKSGIDIVQQLESIPSADSNTTGFPLHLPKGFSMSIFVKDLGNPRVLVNDPNGTILVSIPGSGQIIALPDTNKEGSVDTQQVVLSGLRSPHGMAFQCTTAQNCFLYIAETHQVVRYHYDPIKQTAGSLEKLADLPSGGNHFTRTLLFHPTNPDILLVSVGSSCNVCNEEDWRRAKILSLNVETKELKVFAEGLRNSVFITVHPTTQEVWATEMGRDLIGDDLPPDEVNSIKEGNNYGWPYCYGKNVHDSSFDPGNKVNCNDRIPSHIDFQAHSAPLGLAFFPASPAGGPESWPSEYRDDLLVAYHGSWNRTIPTGYKIVRVKLDNKGNYQGIEDFITGWLINDKDAIGRPVDILFKDKNIYISDDKAGVIYRLIYTR